MGGFNEQAPNIDQSEGASLAEKVRKAGSILAIGAVGAAAGAGVMQEIKHHEEPSMQKANSAEISAEKHSLSAEKYAVNWSQWKAGIVSFVNSSGQMFSVDVQKRPEMSESLKTLRDHMSLKAASTILIGSDGEMYLDIGQKLSGLEKEEVSKSKKDTLGNTAQALENVRKNLQEYSELEKEAAALEAEEAAASQNSPGPTPQ